MLAAESRNPSLHILIESPTAFLVGLTKKIFKIFLSGDLYLRIPKKRSLQIFRKVSDVFQRNFNGSNIVLFSSRGQGNFRELEALRPRTSKCVLENVFEAKDVLEDSTSDLLYSTDHPLLFNFSSRYTRTR